MRLRLRGAVTAAVIAGLVALLGACGAGAYTPTQLPATTTPTATPSSAGSASSPPTCNNVTQSYDPLPSLTGAAADTALAEIRNHGRLKVGVSADSLRLASRNPQTGEIEGFDIDMARYIAQAIFGDPNKIELVVISTAQREQVLTDKRVDLVVRAMTMSCSRWQNIAFSSEYLRAGLKILVTKGDPTNSLEGLAGKKVCAPNGSTSMIKVTSTAGVIPVGAATQTGCLVLFQNGEVDAIANDDTLLAGLVEQDPYASVPKMDPLTAEPYGIGDNKDQVDLVRYVNRVMDSVKADGRWKASYDKWFGEALGPAPAPPQSVYGRQ